MTKTNTPTYVSSAYNIVNLKQTPAPLIIGERLNVTGSLKTKKFVLDDDYDSLVDIAREQVEQDGVHCLDVCVDTNDRDDEEQFMVNLVKKLSHSIQAPLVIDSTNPDIIEAAIKVIPGKPIINSINLEGDQSKFDRLAPLMEQYGLPAIAMCIGKTGIAKTVPEKVALAKEMFERGQKYNLKQSQFIFDVCVLPLGTPETILAGKNTVLAIKEIKEIFPECFTVLGISNISFGFKAIPQARKALNSVFLYHAVKHGLDAAIVNAKNIIPYSEINQHERKITENLIFNIGTDALDVFSNYFLEKKENDNGTSTNKKKDDIDPSWSAGKRVNYKIIHRFKEDLSQDVISAIYENVEKTSGVVFKIDDTKPECFITHESALHVLNKYLLPAMKTVGDKFASGELILPFVLKSAECMKIAVDTLEKYLVKLDDASKGKIVLGTVAGDVHDIGKNLVKTIFTNNGYTVYDLGNQVPLQTFVDKIKAVNADAVGLSALLVVTTRQMKLFAEYAKENGLDIPILCGGAIVDSNYINRVAKKTEYTPGIWYCNDMFEGLNIVDTLLSNDRKKFLDDRVKFINAWKDKQYATIGNKKIQKPDLKPIPISISDDKINKTFCLQNSQIDIEQVWTLLNKNELFKAQWGVKGKKGKEHEAEHEELYEKWKKRVVDEKLFEPKIVYGYYKCHGDIDDTLIVENPHDNSTVQFKFQRSTTSQQHCLSDYFAKDDIVAFQVTTAGTKITDIINRWNEDGNYTDAFYLGGLAVIFTEALADYINGIIKTELDIGKKGGLRYSWGYPACPDIAQQHLVWKLLQPEEFGLTLTEVGQIIPEQSTAAIVTHHPEAKYFPR